MGAGHTGHQKTWYRIAESPENLPPILIDTREPKRHPWAKYLTAPTIIGTIETGDFSLPGCEHLVSVERKSLPDLMQCLSWDRERFEDELKRSRKIASFAVVVEGPFIALLVGRYRSNMEPKAALESVISLEARFGCPFHFLGSPAAAAVWTQAWLLRWFREHTKCIADVQRALKRLKRERE
jgi:DNA excision repair protein ERCC-4